MPWIIDNSTLVEGNVWPMPDNAFAHPRSAGCFARFFAQWVRERNSISLIEAVRKTSLIPAQILENSVPQMRRKGRLQVGSDADLVVFNPATFQDRATFVAPNQPSIGVRHLLVNGTPVIQEAARIASALPGVAIRRVIT
jgi:N-acyl-D-glutamate deacylase